MHVRRARASAANESSCLPSDFPSPLFKHHILRRVQGKDRGILQEAAPEFFPAWLGSLIRSSSAATAHRRSQFDEALAFLRLTARSCALLYSSSRLGTQYKICRHLQALHCPVDSQILGASKSINQGSSSPPLASLTRCGPRKRWR